MALWQYVNDYFASMNEHKRAWFVGKNLFDQFPQLGEEWREIVRTVCDTAKPTSIGAASVEPRTFRPRVRTGTGTC